jgi:hypothetical protein
MCRMKRRNESLALAYAASDAYANEAENMAVVDVVLAELRVQVEISELEWAQLTQRLRSVLHTNCTAPGVMKVMALADETRVAGIEAASARRGRERRAWQRHADQTAVELRRLVALTLDALLAEPY